MDRRGYNGQPEAAKQDLAQQNPPMKNNRPHSDGVVMNVHIRPRDRRRLNNVNKEWARGTKILPRNKKKENHSRIEDVKKNATILTEKIYREGYDTGVLLARR